LYAVHVAPPARGNQRADNRPDGGSERRQYLLTNVWEPAALASRASVSDGSSNQTGAGTDAESNQTVSQSVAFAFGRDSDDQRPA
jgi:hypothetical protein